MAGSLFAIQNDITLTGVDPAISYHLMASTRSKQVFLLRRLWNVSDKTEIITLTREQLIRSINSSEFRWQYC